MNFNAIIIVGFVIFFIADGFLLMLKDLGEGVKNNYASIKYVY